MIPQKDLDKYKATVEKAMGRFLRDMEGGGLERWIDDKLNNDVCRTLGKVAGLDFSWDDVKIDHTNGRISALDKRINEVASDNVIEWVQDALKSHKPPKKQMNAAIKREYNNALMERVEEIARRKGEEDAEAMFALHMQNLESKN